MNQQTPLAERMRPQSVGDMVGQEHILGPNGALTPMIKRGKIPSLLFWGPPGVGKTTLAQVLANEVDMPFSALSAVSAGVKDVREVIQLAEKDRMFNPNGRVLFIDEIHRFSKSQQDALLSAVEKGTITLIGATTENPSFEVNSALLSRCQLFVLKQLEHEHLQALGEAAIERDNIIQSTQVKHVDWAVLQSYTGGDARRFLNLLEHLALTAQSLGVDRIDAPFAQDQAPKMALLYDRDGDQHFDMASALIKSVRGSDPDAALYWAARMLQGGEKPEFVARRLLILASEDIGLANPAAITQATACYQAVERLGMPEARIPIGQCVIYLSCSPKSNSSYLAIDAAMRAADTHGNLPVPMHLRNAPTKTMKDLGYGADYQYPHQFDGHFINQSYRPDEINHEVYYEPADNATESKLKAWLNARWPKES